MDTDTPSSRSPPRPHLSLGSLSFVLVGGGATGFVPDGTADTLGLLPAGKGAFWSPLTAVHRFLSKLTKENETLPDERAKFLEIVQPCLHESQRFFVTRWHHDRWIPDKQMFWVEGASAILAEIGPYLYDDDLLYKVYYAIRTRLTPAGRLAQPDEFMSGEPESVQSLRVAFALKAAGRGLADDDARYRRLIEWLPNALDFSALKPYDVAFAVTVLELVSSNRVVHS